MSTVIIQDDQTNKDGSTEGSKESSAAAQVPAAALDWAAQFGAMTQSFNQSQERQARMEQELAMEREAREADRRQLDTISGQLGQVMTAIQKAAAEETAADDQADDSGATQVIPPGEQPPKVSDPPARPSRMERMANWLNGR